MRRKIKTNEGEAAVRAVAAAFDADDRQAFEGLDRNTVATATRYLLEELGTLYPGGALEVRVPPFGAVQCLEGSAHTRGTPPGVVETDPETWLRLAIGRADWKETVTEFRVQASGRRADLEEFLPLMRR